MAVAETSSKSIDCARDAIRQAYMPMNFLMKLCLFACVALLAGMILTGCGSTDEPVFTDNPSTPAVTSAPTNDMPAVTDTGSARFATGETVTVTTATGSDSDPGPIPGSGQPFLISDEGTISLPLVGSIRAQGKTPGELQDDIQRLYVPQYYVRLTVTVTAQSRIYFVGGEVGHPGPEVYLGHTTVTTAIQAAGDFTQFANHKVWLTRADGTRIRVSVDRALKDSTQDPPIFPGDKIHVERRIF
jgi:polysaccharide export outer membrane protein